MTNNEALQIIHKMSDTEIVELNTELQYAVIYLSKLHFAATQHLRNNQGKDQKEEAVRIYGAYERLRRNFLISIFALEAQIVLVERNLQCELKRDTVLQKKVSIALTKICGRIFPSRVFDTLPNYAEEAQKEIEELGIKGIFTKDIYLDPVEAFLSSYRK